MLVDKLKIGLIIFLIAIGLLAVIEIGVRLLYPQSSFTKFISSGDTVAIEHKSVIHRLRPGAHYRQRNPEFNAEYLINSEGMRDHRTYLDREKDSSTTRILLLGDSFSFGHGVNYKDNWVTLLENILQEDNDKLEIVKAGIPAFDTSTEYEYLQELYDSFKPDMVMLGFLPNDLFTNQSLSEMSGKNSLKIEQLLKGKTKRAKAVTRGLQKKSQLHIVSLSKRLLLRIDEIYCSIYRHTSRGEYFEFPLSDHARYQMEITKTLLKLIHHFCKKRGIELLVISIPQQFQVFYRTTCFQSSDVNVNLIDEFYGKLAQNQGFNWIPTLAELSLTYQKNGRDLYYRLDGHLTKYGNSVLSKIIAKKIKELISFQPQQGTI